MLLKNNFFWKTFVESEDTPWRSFGSLTIALGHHAASGGQQIIENHQNPYGGLYKDFNGNLDFFEMLPSVEFLCMCQGASESVANDCFLHIWCISSVSPVRNILDVMRMDYHDDIDRQSNENQLNLLWSTIWKFDDFGDFVDRYRHGNPSSWPLKYFWLEKR